MTVALRPLVSRSCCEVLIVVELTGAGCGRSKDLERERQHDRGRVQLATGVGFRRLLMVPSPSSLPDFP